LSVNGVSIRGDFRRPTGRWCRARLRRKVNSRTKARTRLTWTESDGCRWLNHA